MKLIIYFATLALIVCSCEKKGDKKIVSKEIINFKGFYLSPIADSLFATYRDSVKANAYAIFFDKKEEGTKYTITFAPFAKKVDLYESGAMCGFHLDNNIPVFIYTGIEDFLSSENTQFNITKQTPTKAQKGKEFKYLQNYMLNIDFAKSWSCIFNGGLNIDSLYIVQGVGLPYIEGLVKPTVHFSLPDSSQW